MECRVRHAGAKVARQFDDAALGQQHPHPVAARPQVLVQQQRGIRRQEVPDLNHPMIRKLGRQARQVGPVRQTDREIVTHPLL